MIGTRPGSAAIATRPRRARGGVGMLVPASVPERAFDAPIWTWATEKTHRLIVAVVPGSLSAIANAFWVDSLSKIEIADVADRAGQHTPPPLAKDTLDQTAPSKPWRCTNGRTSTTPPSLAAGQRAAISSTESRLSASNR
jgi:hypothetical protein